MDCTFTKTCLSLGESWWLNSMCTVRILFDSGSHLSYVTEGLQHQLNFKQNRIEKLYLNTLGSDSYKSQVCAVVKLYIRGLNREETTSISALISPAICSPLPLVIKVDSYSELSNLPLADECCKPKGEIDILIGSFIGVLSWVKL